MTRSTAATTTAATATAHSRSHPLNRHRGRHWHLLRLATPHRSAPATTLPAPRLEDEGAALTGEPFLIPHRDAARANCKSATRIGRSIKALSRTPTATFPSPPPPLASSGSARATNPHRFALHARPS